MDQKIFDEVNSMKWFHTFYLAPGILTPGTDQTLEKLTALNLPDDMIWKSVLDIGAYDGFFSFECERRGAFVTAMDKAMWEVGDASRCFDYAKTLLGSRVKKVLCSVEDLDPIQFGTYDIVLFLGVMYHGPSPYTYLQKACSMVKDMIIIETFVDCLDIDRPTAAFYSGDRLINGDPSTKWGCNILAIKYMLNEFGFGEIKEFPLWHKDTGMNLGSEHICPKGASGRVVLHAWRTK